MADYVERPGEGTAVEERQELERPRRYKVLLHNDHYTTMEFVVMVLEEVFRKPHDQALRIMLNVHEQGVGVAGVYVKAVAEAKVSAVHKRARDEGYPLRLSVEPE